MSWDSAIQTMIDELQSPNTGTIMYTTGRRFLLILIREWSQVLGSASGVILAGLGDYRAHNPGP